MRFVIWSFAVTALLATGAAAGDEVRQKLDEAIEEYGRAIAVIEDEVQKQLAELFDRYADSGELEKAQEIAAIRDAFATEGVLPDLPPLRTIREKAKVRFSKANTDLRAAYRAAIANYTRARDLRSAEEVKRSLQEFEKENGPDVLQFPRAERKKSKQREQQQPAPVQASGSDPMPPPGSTAAGGSSPRSTQPGRTNPSTAKAQAKKPEPSEALLAVINKGPERDVLSDRLASTGAKGGAISNLFWRLRRESVVSTWTYEDCIYLSAFVVSEYPVTGTLVSPGGLAIGKSGVQWSSLSMSHVDPSRLRPGTLQETFGDRNRNRFLALWLACSASPEEFVQRTEFLQQTEELASVNRDFTEDDFKVWLSSLGCKSREDVEDVIGKLRRKGVTLEALSMFVEREGL